MLSSAFHQEDKNKIFWQVFSNINKGYDITLLRNQWENLLKVKNLTLEKLEEMNARDFWYFVQNFKYENKQTFFELGSIALVALYVPHGNADTEKVFSQVKDIKTVKRNRLSIESVDAILKTKQVIKICGKNKFEPPEEMIKLFLTRDYKEKKKDCE